MNTQKIERRIEKLTQFLANLTGREEASYVQRLRFCLQAYHGLLNRKVVQINAVVLPFERKNK